MLQEGPGLFIFRKGKNMKNVVAALALGIATSVFAADAAKTPAPPPAKAAPAKKEETKKKAEAKKAEKKEAKKDDKKAEAKK